MQKNMMWAGRINQATKRGRPNATLVVAAVLALSSALSGCSSLYSEGAVAGAGIAGAAVAGKPLGAAGGAVGTVPWALKSLNIALT